MVKIVEDGDEDGDGSLSVEEFVAVMNSNSESYDRIKQLKS